MSVRELVENYTEEYSKQKHPFLLADLIGTNENAHTKILQRLLVVNEHKFFQSFLEMAGLPVGKERLIVKEEPITQKASIGESGNGYMDLYFRYNGHYVIVENKINDAPDVKWQLARYVATVLGINDFEKWLDSPFYGYNYIHVIYLTLDGSREVNSNLKKKNHSLPDKLRNAIDYITLNYQEDILPWLIKSVLPNCTYDDDGIMIAGIRQYVAFLEQLFNRPATSSAITEYVNGLPGDDVSKFNKIIYEDIPSVKWICKTDNLANSLVQQLKWAATDIFSGDLEGSNYGREWRIYVTPSYFVLYKQQWSIFDGDKKRIYPSVHIVGTTKQLLRGRVASIKWVVEHVGVTNKSSRNRVERTKRLNIKDFKASEKKDRQCFWTMIIETEKIYIEKVDHAMSNDREHAAMDRDKVAEAIRDNH